MEYKITAIDPDPPREWSGPNGVVYYITVGLEGHPKPVSIGKKSPDALKVGDTVTGTIIPTDYLTDKWKGESKPTHSPSTHRDSGKDITLGMVWKTVAGIRGLPENDTEFAKFFEIVRSHLDELLLMSEQMRGSQGLSNTPPSDASGKTPTGHD